MQAVLKAEHPLNAAYRQTATYWEMVYSMARHGIVSPAFWLENNGEGLFLFVKVEPFLETDPRGGPADRLPQRRVGGEGVPRGPVDLRAHPGRVAQIAAARG